MKDIDANTKFPKPHVAFILTKSDLLNGRKFNFDPDLVAKEVKGHFTNLQFIEKVFITSARTESKPLEKFLDTTIRVLRQRVHVPPPLQRKIPDEFLDLTLPIEDFKNKVDEYSQHRNHGYRFFFCYKAGSQTMQNLMNVPRGNQITGKSLLEQCRTEKKNDYYSLALETYETYKDYSLDSLPQMNAIPYKTGTAFVIKAIIIEMLRRKKTADPQKGVGKESFEVTTNRQQVVR